MEKIDIQNTYNSEANKAEAHERSLYTKNGYIERRRVFTKLLKSINPQPKTALDIGCGAGNYFDIYKLFNIDISGLDLSEQQLKKAKEDFPNTNVYHTSFEEFEPPTKFDLIVAIGVITTTNDVESFFSKVNSILNKNGNFILSFLNQDSICPKSRREPNHNFFSEKNLINTLKKYNLSLSKKTRMYMGPFITPSIAKLLCKTQISYLNHAVMAAFTKND